jgi:hypothetical protein
MAGVKCQLSYSRIYLNYLTFFWVKIWIFPLCAISASNSFIDLLQGHLTSTLSKRVFHYIFRALSEVNFPKKCQNNKCHKKICEGIFFPKNNFSEFSAVLKGK